MGTSASPPRVTSMQIAREAGVSRSTVSLVLNQRGDALRIHPRTQQRVLAAARRLAYVPDYLARGLSGASTRSIGVLWPLGGSPSNASIAYRLNQRFAQRGYLAFVSDNLRSGEHTHRLLRELAQRRVDALVLYGGGQTTDDQTVRELLSHFEHAVVVGPQPTRPGVDFICHDRKPAMRQIANHFADIGRRRPTLLTVGQANVTKIEAFVDQMRERGLDLDRASLLEVPYEGDDAMIDNAIAYLNARYPQEFPFDAVACTSDGLALALYGWLRERGMRVPDDVAVTGFDNTDLATHAQPPLASVDRKDTDVADAVETMLFERIDGLDAPARENRVDMRFVARASAGI